MEVREGSKKKLFSLPRPSFFLFPFLPRKRAYGTRLDLREEQTIHFLHSLYYYAEMKLARTKLNLIYFLHVSLFLPTIYPPPNPLFSSIHPAKVSNFFPPRYFTASVRVIPKVEEEQGGFKRGGGGGVALPRWVARNIPQ